MATVNTETVPLPEFTTYAEEPSGVTAIPAGLAPTPLVIVAPTVGAADTDAVVVVDTVPWAAVMIRLPKVAPKVTTLAFTVSEGSELENVENAVWSPIDRPVAVVPNDLYDLVAPDIAEVAAGVMVIAASGSGVITETELPP